MNPNHSAIACFTVTEFRTFKRALRTLLAAGVHTDQAVEILVTSTMQQRYDRQSRADSIRRLRTA